MSNTVAFLDFPNGTRNYYGFRDSSCRLSPGQCSFMQICQRPGQMQRSAPGNGGGCTKSPTGLDPRVSGTAASLRGRSSPQHPLVETVPSLTGLASVQPPGARVIQDVIP